MACPKCGCKVTYQYGEGDGFDPYDDQLQRCGGCGNIFDIEDSADEDEDFDEAAASPLNMEPPV